MAGGGVAADAGDGPAAPPVNRMVVAALSLIGLLISVYMSLYAIGAIPTIACGTGACGLVQNSPWAVFLGVPVPFIGVAGYGTLLVLAMLGTRPAHVHRPWIGRALVGLAAIGFAFSAWLSYVEAVYIQAWCRWCVGSAIVATLILVAALPELIPSKNGRNP